MKHANFKLVYKDGLFQQTIVNITCFKADCSADALELNVTVNPKQSRSSESMKFALSADFIKLIQGAFRKQERIVSDRTRKGHLSSSDLL